MSYSKNIKRNKSRPKMSQTPYMQGKSSHGNKSERDAIETMKKLDEWNKLR